MGSSSIPRRLMGRSFLLRGGWWEGRLFREQVAGGSSLPREGSGKAQVVAAVSNSLDPYLSREGTE